MSIPTLSDPLVIASFRRVASPVSGRGTWMLLVFVFKVTYPGIEARRLRATGWSGWPRRMSRGSSDLRQVGRGAAGRGVATPTAPETSRGTPARNGASVAVAALPYSWRLLPYSEELSTATLAESGTVRGDWQARARVFRPRTASDRRILHPW